MLGLTAAANASASNLFIEKWNVSDVLETARAASEDSFGGAAVWDASWYVRSVLSGRMIERLC